MKATQIRIYLVAPAIAATLGFGAHVASAGPCINPAGTTVTISSTNVSFKVGAVTASCTSTVVRKTMPASPNNCTPPAPDPICTPLNAPPTFSGCKATIAGINVNATLTATGTWQICLAANGPTAQLIIPQDGLTATASVLGATCTTKAVRGGSGTVSGPFTNGVPSTIVSTNQTVNVTTSGGFPCPSATTASFSGTFTSSPNVTFQ